MLKVGNASKDSLTIEVADQPTKSSSATSGPSGTDLNIKISTAAPPPRRKPVFDPGSGDLNPANLKKTVRLLIKDLPSAPTGAPANVTLARSRVVAHLQTIATIAENAENSPPNDVGMRLRNEWKAAASAAHGMAKSLSSTHPTIATECAITAAIYTELKRKHLSGAAQHIRDDYAQRELENINQAAPGMGEKKSGSLLIASTGGGLAWGPGAPVVDFDVGGYGAGNKLLFVDEQKSVFIQKYASGHAEGNVYAGIDGSWGGRGRARLGTNYIGNDTVGTRMVGGPDLKDVLKLMNDIECGNKANVSADPTAQIVRQNVQTIFNAVKKTVMGQSYATEPGAPKFLSQPKLAKGFASTNLELLVQALQNAREAGGQDKGEIGKLLKHSYPSMYQGIADSLASDRELPKFGIHNSLPTDTFYGDAYGPFLNAKGYFTKKLDKDTPSARGAEITAAFDWDTLFFPNWLPHLAHQTLDFSFSKDASETMHAHSKLDALVSKDAPDPKPPMLRLYTALSRQLGGDRLELVPNPGLDDNDKAYYQGLENRQIPSQFLEGILNPGIDKLTQAADAAQALGQLRHEFVRHADALISRPGKHWSPQLKDALQKRHVAAFDAINEQVWGGAYPGGSKAALKNPEKFIGETHGALSLAFGVVGTHLSIQKRQMQVNGMTGPDEAAAVRRADTTYQQARALFDHDNLNISMQRLGDGSNTPLHVYQMFRRHTVGLTASVDAGYMGNLIEGASQVAGTTTQAMPVNGTDVSVSATSRLGLVNVTGRIKWQKMDYQDSPGRQGQYVQLDLSATAGGLLTGEIMEAFGKMVMEKATGVKGAPKKWELVDSLGVLRQLGGMGLSIEDGQKLAIRWRKAPGNDGYDLEYVRPLTVKDHGTNVNVKIDTPHGNFTPYTVSADHVESPGHEIRGPDLYYLIAQHSGLKSVLAKEDDMSLSQVFAAHPEICTGYFGYGKTIPTVIDRYLTAINDTDPPTQNRNEFHRFFRDPHFRRLSEVANDVASHAPGSRAGMPDPFEAPAPLSEPVKLPHGMDWAAVKTQIAALPDAKARADWYAGAGRPVFDAFVAIMDATVAVDSAASLHHDESRTFGFYTELNPKLAKVAETVHRTASGKGPKLFDRIKSMTSKLKPTATGGAAPYGTLPDKGPLSDVFAGKHLGPMEPKVMDKGKAPQAGAPSNATELNNQAAAAE